MTGLRILVAAHVALACAGLFGRDVQAEPAPGAFRGVLTLVQGDPRPGEAGGGVLFTLNRPGGDRLTVEVAPGLRNAAAALSGRQVVVRGDLTGEADARRLRAKSIEAAATTRR